MRPRPGSPAVAGPLALAALLVGATTPFPAAGQITVVESDALRIDLSGYVQTVSGSFRGSGVLDQGWSGLHGAVGRVAWNGQVGERFFFEVHDRFLYQVGSGAGAGAAGLGVTVIPGRAFDLESTLLEGEDVRLWHDLDRLSVTAYTGFADVTVGRQAITWGNAALFPVADLWGRFSPFELDTQQKPGVDAVRALAYPGEGRELDLVVADGGEGESVSAAARLTSTRSWGDVTVGGGKFWEQAILLGGVTWSRETTNLRVEGALPWNLDDDALEDPRLTLGADGLGVRWSWTVELHLNGIGTDRTQEYQALLTGEAFARGESYFIGRHYAGGMLSWSPDVENRLRLTGVLHANLDDGSTVWFPSASYDLGQSSRLVLGGLVGAGPSPAPSGIPGMAGIPRLRSEFGSYGRFGYLQLAVFF